ncbi:agmatine deiminase family protein [Aurantiacibacter poecillastricola]|uniref:agmatine deiminase family protein n=1 Tax=Aurantiacibacter poecillastricola TaxID=3064385 RepID=UPI00273E2875|nr:agmatine deiminase family protein [Aurantiacibacter sp. 219JJ12-13]MDP5260681.1 agmatine deiminase family protein [Aurantiacibacter sp. 219JJ12-13]
MPEMFRMPGEWARQDWIWIGFPAHGELWEENLVPAQEQMAAFANAVAETGQQVHLVVRDAATEMRAKDLVSGAVTFERHPYGDIWVRDTGPITLLGADGTRRAQGFSFNGWGGKYLLEGDLETGPSLAEACGLPYVRADWILEGGAVESDGTGLVVTTEQCLLNPNRNPGLSREEIEANLKRDLGFSRILWLGDGLAGDHTDGHVDNLARMVGENTIAIPRATAKDDLNAAVYDDARARARDFGMEVREIPSPGWMGEGDEAEPASYMNFAICNDIVVVPIYGSAHDEEAVSAIGDLFPDRAAIGLRADAVLTGGGSFHCASCHVPVTSS